jgi:hypothetical protein
VVWCGEKKDRQRRQTRKEFLSKQTEKEGFENKKRERKEGNKDKPERKM